MKINLKVIIVIIIEISIISIFALNKFDKIEQVRRINVTDASEEEILDDGNKLIVTSLKKIDEVYGGSLNKIIKINERYTYALDFPSRSLNKDDVLKASKKELSDEIVTALLTGFPNNSYEKLGLKSETEAYIATQLAIWELSYKNEDGRGTERSYISSMKENEGFSNLNIRIFDSAKKIVEEAEKNTYENYSKIEFSFLDDGTVDIDKRDDGYRIIGPIKVKVNDLNIIGGNIKVTNSDDKEINSEILDKYGNTLFNPITEDNEFYIKTKYQQDIKAYFEIEGYSNSQQVCYKDGYYYVYPGVMKKQVKRKLLLYVSDF